MMHIKNYFSVEQQLELIEIAREVAKAAPLFTPVMPHSNKPFNVRMTSCGVTGWISDTKGYRYSPTHPSGKSWPAMPDRLRQIALDLAALVGEFDYRPETCLINYYERGKGKLGLHQDNSEVNLKPALISISLGDSAIFAIGGSKRSDPLQRIQIDSGDVVILHGESRLAYHAVERLIPNSSLLKNGGRLNFTIRQVN